MAIRMRWSVAVPAATMPYTSSPGRFVAGTVAPASSGLPFEVVTAALPR